MKGLSIPSREQLAEVREQGVAVGYRGAGIYARYRAILSLLEGIAASRVLIVGCGHGIFDRLLPPTLDLIGVDVSEPEIATASEWAIEHRPRSRYLLGQIEDVDIPPGWADLTIASEVIEHLPRDEIQHFLARLRTLTNPSGMILITVPNIKQLRNRARRLVGLAPVFMDPDHDREYTVETARSELLAAGLEIRALHGAVLYGPFERAVHKLIPPESRLRSFVAARWPSLASHLIFVCSP